jgi:hypothetical protein
MGLRYHVATILGLLFSLGLGALFGSQFLSAKVAESVERQVKAVDELRLKYEGINLSLQASNAKYTNFFEAYSRSLRLPAVTVSIIQTGDYPDVASKVRETLDQAGATIGGTVVISPSFVTKLAQPNSTILQQLQAAHPGLPTDASAVWQTISGILAHGGQEAELKILRDNNLVQTAGDFSKPVEYVVVVGGASETLESRADAVDVPLIKELKAVSRKVVAAEPEIAGISYIPNLKNSEIATVDNADTDIGRITVALALRAAPGNYGTKRTATSGPYPSVNPQQ